MHLGYFGHPVLGDPLYGRTRQRRLGRLAEPALTAISEFPRQALHAAELGFLHPTTGAALAFASPVPADMADLIRALESG